MFVKINKYIEENFAEGSRPDPRTIVAMINRDELQGRRIGKLWYVWCGATSTGNEIADSILAEIQ